MKEKIYISSDNLKQINEFIDLWTKMSKCYFWSPPGSASARRSYENKHSLNLDITIENKNYVGSISTSCSCKIIYCIKTLYVDGIKKNILSLKKLVTNYEPFINTFNLRN